MGKIYRIPIERQPSWIRPEYRSGFGLLFFLALIIGLGFTMTDLSRSGGLALVLLVTPVTGIFVLGLFIERFPKLITGLISSISTLFFVLAIGSLSYFVVEFLFLAEAPICDRWCGWEERNNKGYFGLGLR